jgi:hypothetical protein
VYAVLALPGTARATVEGELVMMVEINWQALAWLTGIALAWTGFLVGVIRWLVGRMVASIQERIAAANKAADESKSGLQQHREEYLSFLGRLPIDYYRREDMIRFETLTHAKLDALAGDIRQLECRRCQTKAQ